ncbi:hypothetical protein FBZ87_105275 [Nitrospirillum amazonense]|uniref:Uncharacterized protein n=1 Tax=Nitrospirillum amazonense TaxID=28077 RepID=A0A560JQE5_9PROT|nr:hypothetical protein [Nitrospirillum amazonense]TWB73353.1 hypothetical protein FBZ87_105275 [Nitrospirillum amazonense]
MTSKAFKFVVGHESGPHSCSWRLWPQQDDIYLLQLGTAANRIKFSFHKSGLSRWALVSPMADGSDRAFAKWKSETAPKGAGAATLLLRITFPTNHLSTQYRIEPETYMIEAAPTNMATSVDIMITREEKESIINTYAGDANIDLHYIISMKSRGFLFAISSKHSCERIDINSPHQKHLSPFPNLRFPDKDTEMTGRPIRMAIMGPDLTLPTVWELGGHRLPIK